MTDLLNLEPTETGWKFSEDSKSYCPNSNTLHSEIYLLHHW